MTAPESVALSEAAGARLTALCERQRAACGRLAAMEWRARTARIRTLRDGLLARREIFHRALAADLGRAAAETDLGDIFPAIAEANHALHHLRRWMRPRRVASPLTQAGSRATIFTEPRGAALILAPWNYPVNLSLGPLISALAAGCSVTLKPSELAPASSLALAGFIRELFSEEEVAVVQGDAQTAQALLALPYDHIFFTGSPAVGRAVMAAAAPRLASITLELGGKSPAVVDASADLAAAARRIAWGKFLNAGQTCIAPDYVLVEASVAESLLEKLRAAITEFYSEKPLSSPDLARIVNRRHFTRLNEYLIAARAGGARFLAGGDTVDTALRMSPTVITGLPDDSPLLDEEIFGPILPVVIVPDLNAAAAFIAARPPPLALYHFSRDRARIDSLRRATRAGNSCINDVVVHYFSTHLPFGGVGNSGLGKAHGEFGFLAFSNQRGESEPRLPFRPVTLTYPPYTNRVRKVIELMLNWLA